jgi:hypothetical protein
MNEHMQIAGLTKSEIDETLLSVGSHKVVRPLSPVEVAFNCKKAAVAGVAKTKMAAAFGLKGTTMIDKFQKLVELDPDILHLVDWGDSKFTAIGFSCAGEIVKMPKEFHKEIAIAVCQHGLTKAQTKSVRQLVQRSKRQIQDCISDVIARRPITTIREVVVGEIVEEKLFRHLIDMLQVERDMLLNKILIKAYPQIGDFTAKLGERRFTVIGGKSVGETIGRDSDFEARIEQALLNKVQYNE